MNVYKLYRVSSYGNLKADLKIYTESRDDIYTNKVFKDKETLLAYYTPLLVGQQEWYPFEFVEERKFDDAIGSNHCYSDGFDGPKRYVIVEESLL